MLSALLESHEVVLAVTQPIDFICVLSAGIFNTIRSTARNLPIIFTKLEKKILKKDVI